MTLFLALLVEVGAATGLYLALGHIQHEESWPRPVERKIEPVAVEAFRIEEAPAPKVEVVQEPKIEPAPEARRRWAATEPELAVPEVEVEIVPEVQPVAKETKPEIVIEAERAKEAEQKTVRCRNYRASAGELKLIEGTKRMRRVPGEGTAREKSAGRQAQRKRGTSSRNSLTICSQ